MSAAKRVAHAAETIRARWEHNVESDPQTEAAQALEDTCQLLDPEVAAELERLRKRVADQSDQQDDLALALGRSIGTEWADLISIAAGLVKAEDEVRTLRTERHSTNESLSEAAEQLRVNRDRIAELETDNAALQKDKEHVAAAAEPRLSTTEVAAWLRKKAREYPTAPERQEDAASAIARLASKVTRGAIRLSNAAGVPPLTVFRASHDSIVMGLYTTRQAAYEHCEAYEMRDDFVSPMSWNVDEDGVAELVREHVPGLESATGYVVTPVEVASEYDEEANE
ncbi:hypothetical protein F3K39_28420 [Streptomyces sp. LBUM 1479]|nr:hypothetical protein [Streptomyces sp. LBUM 1479]